MMRFGSNRWRGYRKTQVEECLRLNIKTIYPSLHPGRSGTVQWAMDGRVVSRISYQVLGDDYPDTLRLSYTFTNETNEKESISYPVSLAETPLPWGGVRYSFICPLSKDGYRCQRIVRMLYLPPGYQYFGCRHCYELTYRVCQESHRYDGLYTDLSAAMQDWMPGFSSADLRYWLERGGKGAPPPGGYIDRLAKEMANLPPSKTSKETHANYLTASELCKRSELSLDNLEALESARLLVPDTPDKRYRPKLASWAYKLAYLRSVGWELEEIRRWAKGRWSTPDPRCWPPERDDWKV